MKYYSLVRKSDEKEVYSSPDNDRMVDNLRYYFDRVNSGLKQQLESPRLTDEQKKEIKLLDYSDYIVKYVQMKELGCNFQKVFSEKDAVEVLG